MHDYRNYTNERPEAPASGAGRPKSLANDLTRCLQCGHLRGRAWFTPPALDPSEWREVDVLCRCSGVVCRHCKKGAIHRPCSYSYDERSGKVLYWASFCYLARCDYCRAREGDGPVVFVDHGAVLDGASTRAKADEAARRLEEADDFTDAVTKLALERLKAGPKRRTDYLDYEQLEVDLGEVS